MTLDLYSGERGMVRFTLWPFYPRYPFCRRWVDLSELSDAVEV
jgi:hypothetical protein